MGVRISSRQLNLLTQQRRSKLSSEKKLVPARTEKEPYKITEVQREAARLRRGYGKPKNKSKRGGSIGT